MRLVRGMLVIISSLFVYVFCTVPIYSQAPQAEWGKIPPSDLSMSSFPGDTNATAVVLFDIGETHMDDDLHLVFTRFSRIKILTDAGFPWGTCSIKLWTKDRLEQIDDIEGATYALGADGNVSRTELDDKAIFEEKVDDNRTRFRFTLPKLTPGCVIEYRYKITSKSWAQIQDWTFQRSEPVLWSEYTVRIPPQIQYSGITRGYERFYINETVEAPQTFQGDAAAYLHGKQIRCNQYHWVVRDAPALRSEPYVTSIRDYATTAELQLAAYIDYGSGVAVKVLKDWETVVDELKSAEQFGGRIKVSGDIRKNTEELLNNVVSPVDKIKAIYDFVRTTIVWDGVESVTADQTPDDVLKTKRGSSAEITFLLLSMLDAAGIEGYPVVLSTRENGRVQLAYPLVSQFDYVLAGTTLNGAPLFLDATDPHRPYDLLPIRVSNTQGLAIKDGPVQWMTIATDKKNLRSTTASLSLTPEGTVEGVVESIEDGYAALNDRDDLASSKELEVTGKVLNAEATGVTVDSATIDGREGIGLPMKIHAHIVGEDYAQISDNLLYVNPLVVNRRRRSPFATPVRKYPVDMAYGSDVTTEITLALPRGYVLKEPLKDRSVLFPNNALLYTQSCKVEEDTLRLSTTFKVNVSEFPASLYSRLRDFYNQMISVQNSQIVLERTTKSSK